VEEAYKRADAYHRAGADAILCHSKKADDSDIKAFMKVWGDRCPVIIVPTKYWHVPTENFADMGVSTIIWANHNMRATVKALQETTQEIYKNKNLRSLEERGSIVPVSEVFRLQNTAELKRAEKAYQSYRPLTETEADNLDPQFFYEALSAKGTTFFSGVPDSLLKDVCGYITDKAPAGSNVISANEGTALATAAGHHLATGQVPCVYLQNSGLGNLINPLLSLASNRVYSIPALLLIGWRGEPGKKDEPQHRLQGELTPSMLKEMNIPFEVLPDYADGCQEIIDKAYTWMAENKAPFALLVKKGTFSRYRKEVVLHAGQEQPGMLKREEILSSILDTFPDTPTVTTTGFTSREVFELRKARGEGHGNDFLTVGSMGHCSSIAQGVAMSKPATDVLCVDGDGAALMHMGAMAITGRSGLKNFKHILVNNGMHDSVGGQPTVALDVNFSLIAQACGYNYTATVSDGKDVPAALEALAKATGPAFLEIKAVPGVRDSLGRPTTTTLENKKSFMKFLEAKL
jgi:phosphonopyruvate decarboxylase